MALEALQDVKERLRHVSAQSLRYRIVKEFWGESRTKHAKACTFYWVMIPSSTIMTIVLGMFASLMFVAFLPVWFIAGWYAGFTPTFVKDKTGNACVDGRKLGYPYKYSPLRGRYKRFAPWQFSLPIVVAFAVRMIWQAGFFGDVGRFFIENTATWLGDWWLVPALVMAFLALSYGIGRLLTRNRQTLSMLWDRLCPDLVVEEANASQS